MFNAMRGVLTWRGADSIRVETNGIEWDFLVPARSMDAFGRVGQETRVLAWLLHREDQMRLYGFPTEDERTVFLELITVEGIGPKQALKILGGIGAEDFEAALDREDYARLESVPGLGHKTAQKLIFALKGKLPTFRRERAPERETGPHEDIVRALADLGYDRRRASDKLRELDARDAGLPVEPAARERELFRLAIVELSGG